VAEEGMNRIQSSMSRLKPVAASRFHDSYLRSQEYALTGRLSGEPERNKSIGILVYSAAADCG
jgi:hypothetical protein